ncbi:PEP-CTERM sorting domain-containing protein [Coraliomargarita sp. SDUM461003]|uniref:PEP-CTERM sorting domain-containing protein n=1 Tax=Thalassobacterium maritimum TaxID=3041265 RepID=A0ABU1AQE6_9BACT|nr:PEP-CTERM sorting domain-containing protein [Coraliomargarita sp. SDUM461003]MDQ8206399.1 PEP-CTERM sorting domain-containing protein [Coraliomargarita sp. SDUM461003]
MMHLAKTHQPKPANSLQKATRRAIVSSILALPLTTSAQLYWGDASYSGTTSTAASWYSDADGTTVSGTAPSSDDITFNTNPVNSTGGTVTLDSNLAVNSITFSTSGNTTIEDDGTSNQIISIGSGGITMDAGSGIVKIGDGGARQTRTDLTASQTWTNNSDSTLTARYISLQAGSGIQTLTLSANGAGSIITPFKVEEHGSSQLSLIIDSAGSGQVRLSSATGGSAFSGGATVLRGHLRIDGSNSAGNSDVTLGNTTGSSEAKLTIKNNIFTSDLTVQSGSSGTKSLDNAYTAGVTDYQGNITLDDNLTLSTRSMTISGDISGAGGITKTSGTILTLSGNNSFIGNTSIEAGNFALDENGTLSFQIGANGNNNQIDATEGVNISLDGTFNFDLTGAELTDGNSWTIVSASSVTYGATFDIVGFTENAGIWTKDGFAFSEATGELAYAVPEPSTAALILGCAALTLVNKRRRTKA